MLSQKKEHGGIRGEFVVILGPYNTEDDLASLSKEDIRRILNESPSSIEHDQPSGSLASIETEANLLSKGDLKEQLIKDLLLCRDNGMKRSTAIKQVSKKTNLPKSVVYELGLSLDWK